MSAVGKMESFDPDNGSITVYLEQMELYLAANSMLESKQVPVLLNLIGCNTYKLLRNFLAQNKQAEMPLADFYKTLRKHFEPKKVVMAEWFHYHRRQQAMADYVAELQKLALCCQLGACLMKALRDRLVCELMNETKQKLLLAESFEYGSYQ